MGKLIKHLREKLKLMENFGPEVQQYQRTLQIHHYNFYFYGRLRIQLCISLREFVSNNQKTTLGENSFFLVLSLGAL